MGRLSFVHVEQKEHKMKFRPSPCCSLLFSLSNLQPACKMFESPPLLSSLRAPVYFLSIGGPSSLENKHHPSYAQLEAIGYDITTKIKPKAVVVFSAHWQDNSPKIKVNAAAQTEIMYDFHGFPSHFYEYKFPYKGSPEVATKVVEKLTSVGLGVERVSRGLDHGIWAGFLIGMYREASVCNATTDSILTQPLTQRKIRWKYQSFKFRYMVVKTAVNTIRRVRLWKACATKEF